MKELCLTALAVTLSPTLKVLLWCLGGLALFFGFMVSVLCFCEITREFIGLLCGAVIIVILGIFDDSRGLSAKFKFCIQIIYFCDF